MFSSIKTRISNYARYTNTLHELRALPMESRIDLDIAGIEDKVAQKAVYG